MTDNDLLGRRIMVAEDEYVIALDLVMYLQDAGAEVIGPANSVENGLALLRETEGELDAAILDINLRNEYVFPLADKLAGLGVPYIFATGYDAVAIPEPHDQVARCEKPINPARLVSLLSRNMAARPRKAAL